MKDNKDIPPRYSSAYKADDDISLKEIILIIIDYSKEIKKSILLIVGISLISALLIFFLSEKKTPSYISQISFMVNDASGNSSDETINRLLGINSSLKLNKITEIIKSGRVIHQVLLSKSLHNNNVDLTANHIINIYNLHEKWGLKKDGEGNKNSKSLSNYYFTSNDIGTFSNRDLNALSNLQNLMLNEILTITYNDKTSIFKLTISSRQKDLTNVLLNQVYNQFIEFYTYQTVGKPLENFEVLKIREDSVYAALKQLEGSLAYVEDRTKGIVSQRSTLRQKDLKRDYESTLNLYNVLRANKEDLEYILKNKSPEFQILDRTFIPKKISESRISNVKIGGLIGFILAVFFVILRKIIRDALAAD